MKSRIMVDADKFQAICKLNENHDTGVICDVEYESECRKIVPELVHVGSADIICPLGMLTGGAW